MQIRPAELELRQRAAAELELRRRRAARVRQAADTGLEAFAEIGLKLTLWSGLSMILSAIEQHPRVAIRAGRKVSKSTGLVAAGLWHAYKGGRVFMTSSSYSQIEGILWHEVRRLVRLSGLGVHVPLAPSTGVRFDNGGSIVGRSVAQRENMQGYSGEDVWYLVDEASGFDAEILEAIEGNVAGGGRIIMAGNPTRVVGPFYDAFHGQAAAWAPVHLSSRQSPNVTGELVERVPGLAVPAWIELMELTHGRESAFVAVHIDGEFPRNASNAVISLELVLAAIDRGREPPPPQIPGAPPRLAFGVDVARTGDDATVVYPVRGRTALEPVLGRGLDSYGVAALVIETARAVMTTDERQAAYTDGQRPLALVDVIGVGAGAYDVLQRTGADLLEVIPVNVAESATAEGYRLLRDQVWYGLKAWLAEGGRLPDHTATREELIAPTFTFDERGRYRVASKDEIKAQLGRSPDHADALALAVHRPPSAAGPTVWSV